MADETDKAEVLVFDKHESVIFSVREVLIDRGANIGSLLTGVKTTTKSHEAERLLTDRFAAGKPYPLIILGCYQDRSDETCYGLNAMKISSIASQVILLSGDLYFTFEGLIKQGIPKSKINAILSEPKSPRSERFLRDNQLTERGVYIPNHITMFETPLGMRGSDTLVETVREALKYQLSRQ